MSTKIRARIGLISPVESLTELAFHRYAPKDVDIRTTRIQMKDKNPRTLFTFCDMMAEAAKVFDGYPQDVIIFGCAGATCIGDKGWDDACSRRIEAASGSPGTTTTTATLEAFEALGTKKLAIMAPYPPEVTDIEINYFSLYGYETVARKRLVPLGGEQNIDSDTVYAQACEMDLNGADTFFVSCMAIDTMDAIDRLEQKLGIPVITSHQVSLWSVLRRSGIEDKIEGIGKLFTL